MGRVINIPASLPLRYNDTSVFSTLADGFPGDPGSSSPQWWLSWEYTFFFFFNFLSYIGVQSINNIVIVSGGQQRDSAIHIHVSILPQTPFPSRLPHNIGQSSLCYTVLPCWLSVLNTAVCACPSQTP